MFYWLILFILIVGTLISSTEDRRYITDTAKNTKQSINLQRKTAAALLLLKMLFLLIFLPGY